MKPLRHCGVLQIEPTDFCNLRCEMCAPQREAGPTVHGNAPKGFMDLELFRKIVDDLSSGGLCFDHLIFQWLGDPALHPSLPELVAYAHEKARSRFQYFRIDTNGIALTPHRVDRLVDVYLRAPEFPILFVFSLDAVSPATYQRVKSTSGDTLERVRAHIDHLVRRRAGLESGPVNLNCQFQFVLQPGNAHEVKAFIEYWDRYLAAEGRGRGYNEIMVKRLSVGAGGQGQRLADALYDEAIDAFGIVPFHKPHVHLEIWEERTWEKDAGPVPDSGRPRWSAGMDSFTSAAPMSVGRSRSGT